MSLAEDIEFERFGPWVDQVRGPDDVPRLYRDAGIDFSTIRAAIKVPRNIERRVANSSMDLYDQLLYLDTTQLVILSRSGGNYTRTQVPISDVVAIEEGSNLLDGRLIIHTNSTAGHRVSFNGSSRATIAAFIHLLRPIASVSTRARFATRATALQRGELGPGGDGLVASFRDNATAEPDLHLIASSTGRIARSSTPFGTFLDRFHPKSLQPVVLATNGRELILTTRTSAFTDAKQPNVSELRRLIRLEHLQTIETAPHSRYRNTTTSTLHVGSVRLEVIAPTDSEVTAALKQVAAQLASS